MLYILKFTLLLKLFSSSASRAMVVYQVNQLSLCFTIFSHSKQLLAVCFTGEHYQITTAAYDQPTSWPPLCPRQEPRDQCKTILLFD